MNRQKPLVSIIITAYNEERHLPSALDAILNQTYQNWEAVIIDDGSTDKTPEILGDYQEKDSRIRSFIQENQGRIPALNDALQKAEGDFLAINDADDIFREDKLEKQVSFLQKNPEHGFVGSYAKIIDSEGNDTQNILKFPTKDRGIRKILIKYNPFVHSSVMYRQEAFKETGYSDSFVPGFEWEVYADIMKSWKAHIIPETLTFYRKHFDSLTHSRPGWQRLKNVTKARWYVFNTLNYPLWYLPYTLWGISDILPSP